MENIKIHIEGDNLSIDNIKIPHLIKILSNIQNTIVTIANSLVNKDSPLIRVSDADIEKYALSITEIKSGSVELVLEASLDSEEIEEEKKGILNQSINKYNEIIDAYREDNVSKIKDILPHKEVQRAVTKLFVEMAKYTANHNINLGIKTTSNTLECNQETFGLIYHQLIEDTENVFEDHYIGCVSCKNIKNKEIEIWNGDKKSVVKANKDFFDILAPLFEKPIILNGIFMPAKKSSKLQLLDILSIKEIDNFFTVKNFKYKNKEYIFNKDFELKVIKVDDFYEIHSEIFDSFEFGENFAEAWQNFKDYFNTTYELLFESEYKDKLSEDSIKLKQYLSENCVVKEHAV